jgi:HEAT repeat protein
MSASASWNASALWGFQAVNNFCRKEIENPAKSGRIGLEFRYSLSTPACRGLAMNESSPRSNPVRRLTPVRKRRILPRLIFAAGLTGAGLAFALLLVVVSVWIENRYPASDPNRAILPGAQKVVTVPIVRSVGRQLENHFRRRAEALRMNTGMSLEETIAAFLNGSVPAAERRKYAYRLARVGSPECIAALRRVMESAAPEHQAFMAQLIGTSGNPAAKELLYSLLHHSDPDLAVAALRGLSAMGGADVSLRLEQILADRSTTERMRMEAAQGLAVLGTAAARDALVGALEANTSNAMKTQVLNSLGHFEFPAVADAFKQFLADENSPASLRTVAVEALSYSTDEAAPLLLELAGDDRDASVRASAAWALSGFDSATDLAPELIALAQQEAEVDVRRRLYEALVQQDDIPAGELLALIQAETDLAARVAAYNALGRGVFQDPHAAAAMVFDREAVPELLRIATEPNSLNLQMRAVFALRRAQTAAAQSALTRISSTAVPQVATAARNGLRRGNG